MANNLNTNLANISNQQGKEGDDAYREVVLQGQCSKTSDTWGMRGQMILGTVGSSTNHMHNDLL